MDLVIKRPKDKPPFIGICFTSEFEAARLNQSWVNSYAMYQYIIIMEPKKTGLDLILTLPEFNFKHKYQNLEFKPEKLYQFLYETKEEKNFNFGHVKKTPDNHAVVRTSVNGTLYVLKIKKIELLTEREWF